MTAIELSDVLKKHQSELGKIGKSLLQCKDSEVVEGLAGLISTMATGVPALGVLTGGMVSKLFASSSNTALRREIEKLDDDESKLKFVREIAGPIEDLIGESLIQIVRTQQQNATDIIKQLGGLREGFETFRNDFARGLRESTILIEEIQATNEATGIHIRDCSASYLRVIKVIASGKGTTGVLLG